ncbi:MAG: VWA domain-containing protein [Saprospiraceae bacterium]|nr:VWA domain-containing protein [Saprospiraceae bacterium]
MLTVKQFTIAIAAGLFIWFGTNHYKSLLRLPGRIIARATATVNPRTADPVPASFTMQAPIAAGPNSIQVALLLDASGSMDGLIEQAKSQLWKILNELNRMRKNGEMPALEVALYEYGNPTRSNGRGFEINQLSGFTTDMDLISEKLFAITTNGGDEYCGAAIKTSLEELAWRQGEGLRIIYVAGNEPFTQGRVDFRAACANAVERGIIVNTIHCGNCEEGIEGQWLAGARAGKGEYNCINQDQRTVYIQTPYDDQINALNAQLNDTYIPMGQKGKSKKDNQYAQDTNAAAYDKANAAERSAFKSSKNYKAEDWDLVDAYKKDKKVVENRAEMPDSLRNLSIEEMEAKIQAITARREAVQQQMQQLDAQRRQYIEQQQSQQLSKDDLGNTILQSLRKQASEKGFEVEKL